MATDTLADLKRQLELLVSIYRPTLGATAVAEALDEVANWLRPSESDHEPQWFPKQELVEVPFNDITALESSIEDIISRKALCIDVDDVPLHARVTLRLVAGSSAVNLSANCVQKFGERNTVLQLPELTAPVRQRLEQLHDAFDAADDRSGVDRRLVDEREALSILVDELLGTPLPTGPEAEKVQPELDREAAGGSDHERSRVGDGDSLAIVGGDVPEESVAELAAAETDFEEVPEVLSPEDRLEESPAAERIVRGKGLESKPEIADRSPRIKRALEKVWAQKKRRSDATKERETRAEPEEPVDDRSLAERTGLRDSTIEAAEKRLRSENMFEVLGVHFSVATEDVVVARDELLELLEPREADGPALREKLDRIRERVEEAAEFLLDRGNRRLHRAKFVDKFQLESLVEMYHRRAETAKMRRDRDSAREAYEHVLELAPDDEYARRKLTEIENGLFDTNP